MLRSNLHKTIFYLKNALILSAMLILSSCMPTSSGPSVRSGQTAEKPGNSTPSSPTYQEPAFPLSGIFVQEGATRTNTSFVLPVNFQDSFLIRGLALSQYLRTIPNTTKFCLVGKFNETTDADKFLIISAKPKSFTDLVNKTTEFYLQVEPSNDTANQNDCLNYNLTTSLFQTAKSPSVHFSLTQLCSDCTTTLTSSGLRLYFINGQEVPSLQVSTLLMTLSGSTTSSVSSCVESTTCKARGFDCCLQGQCVTEGAQKPGVSTLAGFAAAEEDVRLNPERFVVYPQYYYVCDSRPDSDGSPGGSSGDPDYEASVRLMELKQLYDCINLVDGEFSHCTLKYTQANESMPGNFSAESGGFLDDVNFSTLNSHLGSDDKKNNIVKIIFAGETVYEQGKKTLVNGNFGTPNDDLSTSQSVNLNLPVPVNAKDANLYISYKVDGTCERISMDLAKCLKTYIQASTDTSSTMWHDSSKVFKLPDYADVSSTANLIVKISGIVVPEDTSTWSKAENPNRIIFSNSYSLFQNQKIEITYFVKSNAQELIKLKTAAQEKVNFMCTCASGSKCNLRPKMNTENTAIVDYECTYPVPSYDEPPANQTAFVSNKNIAHRYFDANGVSYDEDFGPALDQELTTFRYNNNNVLKPNNVSQYIGFNEIYGSFAKSGTYVARPAKMVRVKKGQQYDIIVNSGTFSSCTTCGSDYYSTLQKIFPQNFSGQGGGYAPDNFETRREGSTSLYRSDDLLYGRACFVPATMIPWTHMVANSPRDQRRNRLSAQHFLFANGYNRDWYGFDYGSLIGSFDGVSWFSIGNQRRIKTTTNKLYLAVNAYLGDLNVDSNFNVLVSETTAFSSPIPDHDTETDGAQCQKSHFCSNDNDCFRQLGYEYTCQNVNSLTTSWPQFDSHAAEVVGSSVRSLLSIVGGSNGQSKRCVYRGRGTPCLQNLDFATTGAHFNGSTLVGTLMCSHNNSCVPLTDSRFNDRIARFANSPLSQNISTAAPTLTDTVGLGARIILRPFDYYGNSAAPSGARVALNANNVSAVCVPGKNVNAATDNYELNSLHPNVRKNSSDKIFGIGPTSSSTSISKSLNACPATDETGTTVQLLDLPLGDETLNKFTISQNLSTNLLNLAPLVSQKIYSTESSNVVTTNSELQVTTVGYQKNACLRAPGASCFSDMDCAPSTFIAGKAKAVDLLSFLNEAEVKYWQEELVCGNPDFKFVAPGEQNPNFDLKKNKCCREFGKKITVYTQTETSDFEWCNTAPEPDVVRVAGVNSNISSQNRYSRVHTAYDKMTCDRASISNNTKFALSLEAPDAGARFIQILAQYKTLDTVNSRTCCTGNWVRNFASENGGGHAFGRTKMQNIDKIMFRNISWAPDNANIFDLDGDSIPDDPDSAFECGTTQFTNSSCEIKNLNSSEEENYLTWAGSLELIGIPQVAIKTTDQVFKLVDDSQNSIAPGAPLTNEENRAMMLPSTISNADFIDSSNFRYYSAAGYDKLNMTESTTKNNLKKVFSEHEFNCCIPSGQEVPSTTTASQCCTGFVAEINGPKRCCLPDFTNLTVYLNRYVSSEGRGLPDSAYDEKTGYIKDPGQVQLIAAQKNLCCSGEAMTGVAISQLPIPLTGGTYNPPDTSNTTRRFNYRTDEVDNNLESGSVGSIFDAGVRWNNHVYCVPAGFSQN